MSDVGAYGLNRSEHSKSVPEEKDALISSGSLRSF